MEEALDAVVDGAERVRIGAHRKEPVRGRERGEHGRGGHARIELREQREGRRHEICQEAISQ